MGRLPSLISWVVLLGLFSVQSVSCKTSNFIVSWLCGGSQDFFQFLFVAFSALGLGSSSEFCRPWTMPETRISPFASSKFFRINYLNICVFILWLVPPFILCWFVQILPRSVQHLNRTKRRRHLLLCGPGEPGRGRHLRRLDRSGRDPRKDLGRCVTEHHGELLYHRKGQPLWGK